MDPREGEASVPAGSHEAWVDEPQQVREAAVVRRTGPRMKMVVVPSAETWPAASPAAVFESVVARSEHRLWWKLGSYSVGEYQANFATNSFGDLIPIIDRQVSRSGDTKTYSNRIRHSARNSLYMSEPFGSHPKGAAKGYSSSSVQSTTIFICESDSFFKFYKTAIFFYNFIFFLNAPSCTCEWLVSHCDY